MTSRNRAYGLSSSLKLYAEPDKGTNTVYDTLGGGYAFSDARQNSFSGYRGWSVNELEGGRALRYMLPEQANDRFPGFQLTYTSYGYSHFDSEGRTPAWHSLDTYFYFGIPTAQNDLPRMGTAGYRGIAEGRLYDFYGDYHLKGTATLTADFASGDIRTTLLLNALNLENGASTDLGSFDGLANLTDGENAFRGTWIASSSGYVGSILGSFFGPQASEFGYTFGINKPDLSALGGGVVVGGTDPSVPPPPVPPAPAPPPPGPAGSPFPLAGSAEYEALSASLSYTGSSIGGYSLIGSATTAGMSDQLTITVTPDYKNGTYTVRDSARSVSFALNKVDPAPDPAARFVYLTDGEEGSLRLFNNLTPQNGTNIPELQFHYLSFGLWYANDRATSEHRTTALLFGAPTTVADLPRTGSATYDLSAFGSALLGLGELQGEGRLTADFATGAIDNQLYLFTRSVGADFRIGHFSGSASLAAGSPFFSGSLSASDSSLTGTFTGSFFGPGAAEVGYTFALSGTLPGPQQAEQRIVGVAVGAR